MLPEGSYPARAVSWDLCVANTGTEQIAIMFEIAEGEHAGQSRTWFGPFTEAAVKRTLQALRACGWKGVDLTNLDGLGTNLVRIVIKHETYEGKTRDKIAFVNPLNSLMLRNAMNDDARRRFAARMRSIAATVPEVADQEPQQRPWANAPEQPPFPEDDNDIPF